ncbi:Signal transduction histidine kinase [Micromonospora pallida]|uniref:Oxygen sensor histidine kinase NreB n=1 Tax=Micromonospora pallida TaxID=145854 RepID=A0A1C6S8W2_9ACTN|nr:sensor histidine kinase [Micromonospora pallida]SCL25893.1 Signal transduction histidine kinase [Micromonospora pallida]
MKVEPTPWLRPGPSPRQRRDDVLVGAAVAAVALLNLTLANSAGAFVLGPPPAWPEQVFWTLACTVPLVVRRRWPAAVAIVISAAFIAAQFRQSPEQQVSHGALYAALYTVGAWSADRIRARRVRIGIIAAMFGWLALALVLAVADLPPDAFAEANGPLEPLLASLVNGVLVNVFFFGFAYLFGDTAWTAARRRHELEVQAEELRRSQADAAQVAVMGERVRIARELHDVVAHHVSVMGVQASATRRVMDKDPDKARTALAAVEQSARTAVDELRRMLNLLRASGPDERPGGVGIDRVEDLVTSVRDAGLAARVGVYGQPVPLPESLSQAAYRIVQEAITNTLKHASATEVDVRVRYHATELEVDVADNGRGAPTYGTAGVGLGLIGMRERVTAHDGTLEADSRPGGGFRVRARFPLVRVPA